MKMIRYKVSKASRVSRINKKISGNKSGIKLENKRIGVSRMSVTMEKPVDISPVARMKQMKLMTQEVMKAKGLDITDIRKMIGIKRYEQD